MVHHQHHHNWFLTPSLMLPALTSEYSLVAGLSALLRRQSKTASGSGEEGARPGRWCSTLTRRVASPIVRVAPEVICWPMWGRTRGPGAQLQLRCREPGMQGAEGSSIRQEQKAAAAKRTTGTEGSSSKKKTATYRDAGVPVLTGPRQVNTRTTSINTQPHLPGLTRLSNASTSAVTTSAGKPRRDTPTAVAVSSFVRMAPSASSGSSGSRLQWGEGERGRIARWNGWAAQKNAERHRTWLEYATELAGHGWACSQPQVYGPRPHPLRSCARCSTLGRMPSRPMAHSSDDMSLDCGAGMQGQGASRCSRHTLQLSRASSRSSQVEHLLV